MVISIGPKSRTITLNGTFWLRTPYALKYYLLLYALGPGTNRGSVPLFVVGDTRLRAGCKGIMCDNSAIS